MFIVFEGVDGSGKSTQIKKINEYLKSKFYEVVLTREPGGTFSGELIRDIFLTNEFSADIQYILMLAARAEHIDSVILPALQQGKIVLSDRYCDSTEVYQTSINQDLRWMSLRLTKNIMPNITFLLDIEPEIALSRINKRKNAEVDILEEGINEDIVRNRRNSYLKIARENADRYCIINANENYDIVNNNIIKAVEHILNGQK